MKGAGPRRGRRRQLPRRGPPARRCARPSTASRASRCSSCDDRTFEMHEGGKIEVLARCCRSATATTCRWPTRRAWPGCATPSPPTRPRSTSSRSRRTRWPSSPTAPRCSASATSAPRRPCRSWRARRCCSRSSPASTPSRSASTSTAPTRSSRPSSGIAPVFGGINLEDIAAPACFEVEERLQGAARHPGVPRRPARHRRRHAGRARERPQDRRQEDGRPQGRHRRRRRRRRGRRQDPAWRRACADVIGVDRKGAIYAGRDDLNVAKQWFAENTNPDRRKGTLSRGACPAPTCSSACQRPGPHHRRRPADDGRRPDRVRHGQPRSRDPPGGRRRPGRGHRHRPQRLSRTRSTTCWPSRASSGARSTPAPPRSPRA